MKISVFYRPRPEAGIKKLRSAIRSDPIATPWATDFAGTTNAQALNARMTPNPSLKRSANGRPPGPVWRYAVHFRQPGPGVLPSSPAYLER